MLPFVLPWRPPFLLPLQVAEMSLLPLKAVALPLAELQAQVGVTVVEAMMMIMMMIHPVTPVPVTLVQCLR